MLIRDAFIAIQDIFIQGNTFDKKLFFSSSDGRTADEITEGKHTGRQVHLLGSTFKLRPGLYPIFAPAGGYKTSVAAHIAHANHNSALIKVGEPTFESLWFSPEVIADKIEDFVKTVDENETPIVVIDSLKNLAYLPGVFGRTEKGVPNDIFLVASLLDRTAKLDGVIIFAVFNTLSGTTQRYFKTENIPGKDNSAVNEQLSSLPSVTGLNAESSGLLLYDNMEQVFSFSARDVEKRKVFKFPLSSVATMLGVSGEEVDYNNSLPSFNQSTDEEKDERSAFVNFRAQVKNFSDEDNDAI